MFEYGPNMDLYHVWCDLKPSVSDQVFADRIGAYLGHLVSEGLIHGFRLTRRKLGLGPPEVGEFHILIEVENLTQLDGAFYRVAARQDPIEGFHQCVNTLVVNAKFALYRDFPDTVRVCGEERF